MTITRSLTRSITRAITRSLTQAGAGGWTPALWFLASEQGVWYDGGDMSAMFQDSSGTTPVTAVEQPVGLALDKRLGLVRGPELVTNGGFDSASGWSFAGAAPGFAISGGKAEVTAVSASNRWLINSSALTAGRTYEITADVVATSGGLAPDVSTVAAGDATTSGSKRWIVVAAVSTLQFIARTNFVGSIDNISVRELPGNHATQATTAQKSAYRSAGFPYLGFDRVDDNMTAAAGGGGTTGIIVCAAIRAGGAGNARTIFSDRGTNTGYRLSVNASNQLVLSAGNGAAYTEVVGPTITAGTDYVVTGWHDGTNLNVQANAGAATSAAFGTATAGTAGFTIGKDNGAATGYYSERIYEIVYRKDDASTAGDRTSLITYMAVQAGITL